MVACAFAAGVYAKDTLADAADTIRHLMRVAAGPPPIAAGGWDDPQSPPELRTSSIPSNGRRAVSVGRFAASLPLPETYGLYVVSDDQLARLEPMRMRVPDTRIALPGLITKPSPVVVPDGPLSFIVYQRELMSSAPDQASIRVIAKVARVLKFGAAGQPTTTDLEDTWAARSVSVDLTVAPGPGHPEMMLVRPADPEQALSPGRYMLVFKNQAYDFAIDGAPTDATHCLERTETQNGAVYTECRSPNGTT